MTPLDARRELSALRSDNEYFTEAQCRRANQLIDVINNVYVNTEDAKTRIAESVMNLWAIESIDTLLGEHRERSKKGSKPRSAEFANGYRAGLRAARALFDKGEMVMTTNTIGRTKVTTTKTGKVKVAPILTAPKTARIAKAKKADRTVKGLVKNRAASKAKAPKKKAG